MFQQVIFSIEISSFIFKVDWTLCYQQPKQYNCCLSQCYHFLRNRSTFKSMGLRHRPYSTLLEQRKLNYSHCCNITEKCCKKDKESFLHDAPLVLLPTAFPPQSVSCLQVYHIFIHSRATFKDKISMDIIIDPAFLP